MMVTVSGVTTTTLSKESIQASSCFDPLQWPKPTETHCVIHFVTWIIWLLLSIYAVNIIGNIIGVVMFAACIPLEIAMSQLGKWWVDRYMISSSCSSTKDLPTDEESSAWINVEGIVQYAMVQVRDGKFTVTRYNVQTSYSVNNGEEEVSYSRESTYKSVPPWAKEEEEGGSIRFRVLRRNLVFAVIDRQRQHPWKDDENYPTRWKLIKSSLLFGVGIAVMVYPSVGTETMTFLFYQLWAVCQLSWGGYLCIASSVDQFKHCVVDRKSNSKADEENTDPRGII